MTRFARPFFALVAGTAFGLAQIPVVLGAPDDPTQGDLVHQSSTSTSGAGLDVVASAAALRAAYIERDLPRYRLTAFHALASVRQAQSEQLQAYLEDLASYVVEHGLDGVDPLLLAIVDGVASRGSAAQKHAAGTTLAQLSSARYNDARPAPNMRLPLARADSYLALDLAPRELRVLVSHMLKTDPYGDVRSLLEVLDSHPARADLCSLPVQLDQAGQVPLDEARRQDNCSQNGFAGEPGSGSAGEALGGMSDSGCNLATPEEIGQLMARANALEECLEQRGQVAAMPDVALGPALVVAAAIALVVLAPGDHDLTKDETSAPDKDNAIVPALRSVEAAQREADAARDALSDAASEMDDALAARNDAQEEYENAQKDMQDDPSPENAEALRQAEQALEAAKQDYSKSIDDAVKAYEELKAAEDKLKNMKNKVIITAQAEASEAEKEQLPPADAFSSFACSDVMADLDERWMAEKIGGDLSSWNQRRLDPKANWSPDGGTFDTLTTPLCGIDSATINSDGAACAVLCVEGAECSCSSGGTVAEPPAHLAARLAGALCSLDIECPNGAVPRGVTCECSPTEEEGGVNPRPPLPYGVAETLFGTTDEAVNQDATVLAVRSLFDGRGRVEQAARPAP